MATGTADKAAIKPSSDLEQVMEHVQAIKKDFAALAETTGEIAARRAKEQKAKVTRFASDAAERAETYGDVVADKVRDHPLAAVGIAALLGVVVSSLRRR